jgi:hypothetical protein
VFTQLFRQADTDGLGVVTGEVAVKFFEKTRLEPRVLGEVRLSLWRRRRRRAAVRINYNTDCPSHLDMADCG